MVIFAAGVRPRDELARAAGLPLADRGGVLTDLTCATADPDVYAVGEVAAIDGRCYGLVGPGYTSAEVVADRLLGGAAEFGEADMSTKLKLLGVDVASFGDAMGATPDCLEVVVNDAVNADLRQAGALRRRQDAARRRFWSATRRPTACCGRWSASSCPAIRWRSSHRPDPTPVQRNSGSARCPAAAQICSCNNVTKGDLTDAIAGGCADVPALKSCTKAGTSCGSCVPLLKQLLEAEGVEQSKALCEHFGQSRAELFEIVSATGDPHLLRADRALRHAEAVATSANPWSRRSSHRPSSDHILDGEQAVAAGLQRPLPGQHPDATAATRWCRGCPAATSPPSS